MICRDHLLALLSDVHLLLSIRPEGNFFSILHQLQASQPRRQWVMMPPPHLRKNDGNTRLVQAFPQWARPFSLKIQRSAHPFSPEDVEDPPRIPWETYLYHYTRSCPGPWPGQTYEEYLLGLLRGDPDSGHTILDTLARIFSEGRIRAGSRLVRGDHPVISWTSRSPLELTSIRRWNPGLIRWTFEPYGIAVRKRVMRLQGAKPAIYGDDLVFSTLDASERYRFQMHRPPGISWKIEREWRSPGDLVLGHLSPADAFVFLPERSDAERLEADGRCRFPVIPLKRLLGVSSDSLDK
jgi:hypothetical protein